jgi:hypothetical protein
MSYSQKLPKDIDERIAAARRDVCGADGALRRRYHSRCVSLRSVALRWRAMAWRRRFNREERADDAEVIPFKARPFKFP